MGAPSYRIYDGRLEDELGRLAPEELKRFIFLEPHAEYPNNFKVNSFDPFFIRLFYELIGDYQCLSLWKLPQFFQFCDEGGYTPVFLHDPLPWFDRIAALDTTYPFELGLTLKAFQTQGFNFLRDNRADIVDWSTGTGKSVFACAKAKYLLGTGQVDKVVIVSKAHARIAWQRQIKKVADLDAEMVGFYHNGKRLVEKSFKKDEDETAAQKAKTFRSAQYNDSTVFIVNYEKFRDDEKELSKAFKKQRVYFVWDEMPTKLKNAKSELYKGTRRAVKCCKEGWHSLLSATAIENIPEDVYYCVKMMNAEALPETVADFRDRYVKSWSFWSPGQVATWDTTKLQELGLRLAHMTHKASKYLDPEIAAQFPKEQWDDVVLELSSADRKLYDAVLKQIMSEYWEGMNLDNILSKMLVLQLICNNPATVALSDGDLARRIADSTKLDDKHSAKLDTFRDLIENIEGKIVTFTMYNELGARPLARYLTKWGVPHVLHDGSATKKQAAIDAFQSDPAIKVFLSSDQGSDSINLDAGSSVINYDLPWKYSTLIQRVNRVNRITSLGRGIENVYYYNLIVANSMEERKLTILNRKRAYLEAFGAASVEQAEGIAALTRGDLWYILTGSE